MPWVLPSPDYRALAHLRPCHPGVWSPWGCAPWGLARAFSASTVGQAMVPFCKPLGLTSPSVSRAPEGRGGCTPRLCQRGPQRVAGFSCKCLSSLPVAARCREWLTEQCKWRKDTKGGEGGTEGALWEATRVSKFVGKDDRTELDAH